MDGEQLVIAFVRGETEWDALEALGVEITITDSEFTMREPAELPVVYATVADLATGLVVHWALGTSLQGWARVLLGTGTVDLTFAEDAPEFDLILGAVSDAAFGGEPSPEAIATAQQLAT